VTAIEESEADEPAERAGVGDIFGAVGAVFADARGPMNTGSGPQYNVSGTYVEDAETGRLRRKAEARLRPLVGDQFVQVERWFVRPPGYAAAEAILAAHGMVLLSGSPGIGRRSAALMLLRSAPGSGRFRELSNEDSEDGDVQPITLVEPGDRVLFDASVSDQDPAAARRRLEAYRLGTQDRSAPLVVVLGGREMVPDWARGMTARLDRPDAPQVLSRHLHANGVPFSQSDVDGPVGLAEHLANDPMHGLSELAELVARARLAADGAGGFGDWLLAALAAATDHSEEVAERVNADDGRSRALLLAAAVFADAPVDAVADAAARLLSAAAYPPHPDHLLDRPDLSVRLAAVDLSTAAGGTVRFAHIGWDAAVRAHFWRNFPELREKLRDWFGEAVQSGYLTGDDRDRAVDRVVEQCLALGRADDVYTLSRRWTQAPTGRAPQTAPLAARALENGLADERWGYLFRQQIYRWATDRRLPVELAQVLVAVCGYVLVRTHPERAVVRLHHLARHREPAVRSAATSRLRELSEEDPRILRQLIGRLADGLAGPAPQSHVDLFLDLTGWPPFRGPVATGSSRVRHEPSAAAQLADAWSVALARAESDAAKTAVRHWLAAYAEHGSEPLLDILVDATVDQPAARAPLYVAVRDWVSDSVDVDDRTRRQAIAAWLRQAWTTRATRSTEQREDIR
jgi:hypothetical protein